MKKIVNIIMISIIGLIFLTGCEDVQKDKTAQKVANEIDEKTENMKVATTKTEPVKENIIGIWNCVLSGEEFNEAYTFNADGTYVYEIGTKKTTGTYILENNILTVSNETSGKETYEIHYNYEKETNGKTYDLVFLNPETEVIELELEKENVD